MNQKVTKIKDSIALIRARALEMPRNPGVYQMFDAKGRHLYIGKAKDLPKRVSSYANIQKLPNRLKRMVLQIASIEWILTKTESEALLLEASMIRANKPPFNIALKDDKSFPYITIDKKHDFPRIAKYRGKINKDAMYFGPFASAGAVNQTITELQRIFLIRPCSNDFFASRKRPCLQYQIKRCSAPCVDKISKQDYAFLIKETVDFLSGRNSSVQRMLIEQMDDASNKMEYEKAAQIRDRIKVLTQIQAKNVFTAHKILEADLITVVSNNKGHVCIQVFFIRIGRSYGSKVFHFEDYAEESESKLLTSFISQFYHNKILPQEVLTNIEPEDNKILKEVLKLAIRVPKNGGAKDLVEFAVSNTEEALKRKMIEKIKSDANFSSLKKLLGIKKEIKRIEVYDNSHTYGTSQVGCMIVATASGFDKNAYRIFNIKDSKKHDDYGMMREVFARRLKALDESNFPDLVIVDGGKGQLNVVKEVFDGLGVEDVKIISVAKGENRNAGMEVVYTDNGDVIKLPKDDKTLHFIQYIRNEVHRFAITSHKKQRDKKFIKSQLDNIPSIGAKRKKDLLGHFGSVEAIKNAKKEDLLKVSGISEKTADIIKKLLV